MDGLDASPSWTFLTSHARVLILIARDPGLRLRDAAAACGVTERTVQAIVADLEEAGYLSHTRDGRRNRYRVIPGTRFRHPAEAGRQIAGLLALVNGQADLERPLENPEERIDEHRPRAPGSSAPWPHHDAGA